MGTRKTPCFEDKMSEMDTEWVEEGRRLSGLGFGTSLQLPEWVDPVLIKEGQAFVQRHLFSVLFAHLLSLLFLLCYAPIKVVLHSTGHSHSPQNSKRRYASTLLHIKKWYEGDLLKIEQNTNGSTLIDILRVRHIHASVAKRLLKNGFKLSEKFNELEEERIITTAIRVDLKHLDGAQDENNNNIAHHDPLLMGKTGTPIISQLDMAVTQFCFMGFIHIFPRQLGIDEDEVGLKGFLHVWALLGHHLGIRPQYNLALPENEFRRELIWKQVLLPHFATCHPNTWNLWDSLVKGLNTVIPFLKLEALLLFITHRLLQVGKDKSNLWGLLNLDQLASFHLIRLCFSSWIKFSFVRCLLNTLVRIAIYRLSL